MYLIICVIIIGILVGDTLRRYASGSAFACAMTCAVNQARASGAPAAKPELRRALEHSQVCICCIVLNEV